MFVEAGVYLHVRAVDSPTRIWRNDELADDMAAEVRDKVLVRVSSTARLCPAGW